MSEDDDIQELREERMEELREQAEQQQDADAQQEAKQQADAQKQAILRQALTDGARQRLNSVRMSKPSFAEQVEQQLIGIAQSGRLNGKIDEDQMRDLLQEMSPDSQSFDIKRR